MDTKNQLLRFFIGGRLSLSDYDYKFMANLFSIIEKHDRITTKQDLLFSTLVKKYRKQLSRNNITQEKISSLEWTCQVVPTSEEYTSAYLYIDGDMLKFRTPFHKPFIQYLNKKLHDSHYYQCVNFQFDPVEKVYSGKFSTFSLKEAYMSLHKYFKVRYCDTLADTIKQLEADEGLIYDPTLKLVNGRIYLVAANEYLYEAATKIGFDLDINTFYKLGRLGINLDDEVANSRPDLSFAVSSSYTHDIVDIDRLISYIDSIPDIRVFVDYYRNKVGVLGIHTNIDTAADITKMFAKDKCVPSTTDYGPLFYITSSVRAKLPSIKELRARNSNIHKIIALTDSRSIEVK